MYKEYFGFEELPFSIAPDPRYLYMSEQHREALAHLIYGINSDGGFVLLTGEVGTGKTTVCRCLLEQVNENSRIAFIINPKITAAELLATICDEFGIRYPEGNASIKVFVDLINSYLLDACANGSRAVLIIDEAQNLETDVLEQLRLLTNLETNQRKLLQIILLGQPELNEMLARPELRQLNQRITARCHLGPLIKRDVAAYVSHRIKIAGLKGRLFPDSTIGRLYRLSGGIPRVINILCDRALIGTYVQGRSRVSKRTLAKAAREVFGKEKVPGKPRAAPFRATAAFSIFLALALLAVATNNYNKAIQYETQGLLANQAEPIPEVIQNEKTDEQLQQETFRWLFGQTGSDSKDTALETLFSLWGIPYQPRENATACQQALASGLRCLTARGSMSDLRRLNRPAVLKMFDEQGRESYAALTALRGQTAALTLGGETREIPLLWFGEYTLLWRQPPDYRGIIVPGEQNPVVLWLENKLALVKEGMYEPRGTSLYDDVLVATVKEFQKNEGLVTDGLVGPQTLIRLNAVTGAGMPLLTAAQGNI